MSDISGNLKGIRGSIIEELRTLYDIRIEPSQLISCRLAKKLAELTNVLIEKFQYMSAVAAKF
ncbi:MAG: hypothetical protein LUF25_07215 [Phascolarctobacterium sp.]|nr:hypothetical protein [Phascolarctobacterium sp.]